MATILQPSANLGSERTGDRLTSPALWEKFNSYERVHEAFSHVYWEDDFHVTPVLTTASGAINRYPYMSYIDTGNTITTLATEKMLGVLRFSVDASDNDGPVITMQGNDGTQVVISDTAGDDMPLWFEARWRKSSVTDNQCAMFLGLTEEARGVDNGLLVDDTGVLADIDHIGFNVAHDNGEELNFAYTKSGQTDVELIAAVDSLVIDTWYKNGFKYIPTNDTAERITVYVNNLPQSTFVTGTQIATATFPDAEELVFSAGVKAGEATAVTMDLDWVRLAQKIRAT